MINILIIFLTQYFQGKKMIYWLNFPVSIEKFKVQSLFQIYFLSMNQMDGGKKIFKQFF